LATWLFGKEVRAKTLALNWQTVAVQTAAAALWQGGCELKAEWTPMR
jgi:hypothetical protein